MKPIKTTYDHIRSNNIKTLLLILAFPATLAFILYGILFLAVMDDPESVRMANDLFIGIGTPVIIIGFAWTAVSYWFGDKMMLGFAGAHSIPNDGEHKKVYRAVENVALAAGLPMPKVYIMDDDSLNAFATGHSPQTASVALTRGIIDKLEPLELEGVIAHEMAHIGNRDIRLNLIIITGLGVGTMLAEILFRAASHTRGNENEGGKNEGGAKAALFLIGLGLLIFTFIVAPIIRLAISRTREYSADATAALITRNPEALASALEKISTDAHVESIDKSPNMAQAFIFDPTDAKNAFLNLGSTHPPVEQRIKRLRQMAGKTFL